MVVSLKSLCKRFSSGDRIEAYKINKFGKYPVLGGNGIRGYTDIYNFDGRCAVIGRQGANCGNVKYFCGKAFMTEHAVVVEANEYNDIGYLSYRMSLMDLGKFQSQSAQPGLSVKTISEIPIEVPNLNIQKKIWKILNNISEKTNNNNHINNNLEELMKTIYQRWFIEFEFPNEEGEPYKSNGGKLVYNEELKYRIPEKWKVDNCYDTNMFEIIKPGVQLFEIKNYLATGNVEGNNITDGVCVGYDNRESRANMQPLPNSIWFAKMKNSIKHITLSSNSAWFNEKYILSTGFLGIKCKEDTLCYLHCFIYSDYFEKVKDMLAHGATQEAINNEDLKAIKLIVPDKRVLKLFENYTRAIIQNELDVMHESQRLKSLKEFILPLLMNGQINVDDIEI